MSNKEKFDFTKLPKDLQDLYNKIDDKHKDIVDRMLSLKEGEELNDNQRERPNYDDGSVDEMLVPTYPKAFDLYKRVMSGAGYIYTIEGGARGGKDVFAILIWTFYLMTTPHKTHLALGKSLEHALLTILHSSGFGLYYTIPHGVFVRNSDSGAQRGIYKFKDMYGVEKEVLFYGNDKMNDGEKYQGFTIGSTYVNEGMTQHLNGINQAIQRMFSSHNHLMLITQNPKGQAHPFYMEFEKERLFDEEEMQLAEYIRDRYTPQFKVMEKAKLEECEQDKKRFIKEYCEMLNVPSSKYLESNDYNKLLLKLRDIDFHYDKIISGWAVQHFHKEIDKDHRFYGWSMKKFSMYDKGGDNPNGIYNSYDYTYSHFTVDDNLALTEMQINEAKKVFKKGSALYLQKTLGIRKTAEKSVYKEFSYKNVMQDIDIHDFDSSTNTMRVIGIDPGFNHETGMLDVEIDFRTGTLFALQERKIDYKNQSATVGDIAMAFWDMVRSRKNREMPTVTIIDPSHVATINHFEQNEGVQVTPANNSSMQTRSKDKKYANLNQQKDVMGIDLLNYGFSLKKIYIHPNCVNLINQIESAEFDYNEDTGKVKIKKINDDVVDVLRYIMNTMIGGTQYWTNGGETNGEETEDVIKGILGNERTQGEEWNMDRALAEAQREINQSGQTIFTQDDDRSKQLQSDWFGWLYGKHWS